MLSFLTMTLVLASVAATNQYTDFLNETKSPGEIMDKDNNITLSEKSYSDINPNKSMAEDKSKKDARCTQCHNPTENSSRVTPKKGSAAIETQIQSSRKNNSPGISRDNSITSSVLGDELLSTSSGESFFPN